MLTKIDFHTAKVGELVKLLSQVDPETEVMVAPGCVIDGHMSITDTYASSSFHIEFDYTFEPCLSLIGNCDQCEKLELSATATKGTA